MALSKISYVSCFRRAVMNIDNTICVTEDVFWKRFYGTPRFGANYIYRELNTDGKFKYKYYFESNCGIVSYCADDIKTFPWIYICDVTAEK